MAKTIEELERELDQARNDAKAFRGRFEKADGELRTAQERLAELDAKSMTAEIPQAGAELLGVPGVQAVQHIVQRELGRQAPAATATEERMQRVETYLASQARRNFEQVMDDYVARVGGEPNFMRRIQPGGDMCAGWTAFMASPRGASAQAAFANCDTPMAQMAADSFMLWQSRETIADAPPTGAEAAVPPARPLSEADFEAADARFDARIRAGESPVKVNAERAAMLARFARR